MKNRISLRLTTAAGTAAVVVAGAAFGVSAFADTGGRPDQGASAATLPSEPEAPAPFFPEAEDTDQALVEEAVAKRDRAVGSASTTAAGSLEQEKEEEEEEEAPEEQSGGGGGSPVPAGDSKSIARAMVADYGWGADQFTNCLEPLWERESNWNHLAQNPSSGAYGIPQSLPGSKMASAGADWQTNPATQIKWGLGYIRDRYGSPCEAWAHSERVGWY